MTPVTLVCVRPCGCARAEEGLWPGVSLRMRGCFQGVCLPPQSPAPDTQQVLNPGPAILSVSSWMEGSKGGATVRGVAGVKKRDLGWGVEIPLEAKANRYANTLPEDFSRSHLPAASPGQGSSRGKPSCPVSQSQRSLSIPVPQTSPRKDLNHRSLVLGASERDTSEGLSCRPLRCKLAPAALPGARLCV